MGDTVFKEFNEDWTEVTGLTLDVSYSFQNVHTADLFLQQAPTQPDDREIGKRLPPSNTALIIKEASAIWVRSKTHKGIAIYNEVPTAGGGDGDVVGPASAVDARIATFDGTTGKLIQDSGALVSDLGDVVGPGVAVDENIVIFDSTTGKLIKDSGASIASIQAGAFPVEVFTLELLSLVVGDNLKFILMDRGTQQDIHIPENASQAFPIGAEIHFLRKGTGATMFIALGSAVLLSTGGLVKINSQYSAAALKKIAIDTWALIGALV